MLQIVAFAGTQERTFYSKKDAIQYKTKSVTHNMICLWTSTSSLIEEWILVLIYFLFLFFAPLFANSLVGQTHLPNRLLQNRLPLGHGQRWGWNQGRDGSFP